MPDLAHLLTLARDHWLELVSTAFGIVSVYLSARQNIWSWPTAILNVTLSVPVYYAARLYSDMGLQVVYAVLSVYGWYEWLHGGVNRTELAVSRTPRRLVPTLVAVGVVAAAIVGTIAHRYTDASAPYLDAALTAASLVAQWMMTRKLLENWLVWIAVDIVYVPLLLYKGIPEYAFLYTIFLGLAVAGWVEWRRSLRAGPTSTARA
jgi:nicotinamide mononucleotide transporter